MVYLGGGRKLKIPIKIFLFSTCFFQPRDYTLIVMKLTTNQMNKAKAVIREHYSLNRPATEQEVRDEIVALRRKGVAFLGDRQLSLWCRLESAGISLKS